MYSPICTFIPIWRASVAEKLTQTIPIRGGGGGSVAQVLGAGARTLIGGGGGVYIHIFGFCPTSFFCNKVDCKRN